MGFGFRKSVNLGGGFRLNFSKSNVGVSGGFKGFRVGTGPSGQRMRITIPGTGVYYEKRRSGRTPRTERTRYQACLTQQRDSARLEQIEQNQQIVDAYEAHIELLKSVHKECSSPIDWEAAVREPPPFNLGEPGPNEADAQKLLDNYKPSWIDRWFKRTETRKKILEENIELAKEEDLQLYNDWEHNASHAKRVLSGEPQAYLDVLKEENPFDDIEELGSRFTFKVLNKRTLEVTFQVQSQDVIPNKTKTLTKTGKVFERNTGKGVYYALYQDYVCSCILRIGREIFALLPIETVIIHAIGRELDTSTGHEVEGTLVSVKIPQNQFFFLNFDRIDCSDAVEGFEHRMVFRKTKGFKVVEPLRG